MVNIRNRCGNNNDPGDDLPDGWSLLQWINNEIQASQPWKITIAEDLQNNEWITKDTGAGGAGFGSQWEAAFVHPIRQAIITPNDSDRDMGQFGPGCALPFLQWQRHTTGDIHGIARRRFKWPPTGAGGSGRATREAGFRGSGSTLGAALVFTAPGIPMIFQGQEFLEDGYFHLNNVRRIGQSSLPMREFTSYTAISSGCGGIGSTRRRDCAAEPQCSSRQQHRQIDRLSSLGKWRPR